MSKRSSSLVGRVLTGKHNTSNGEGWSSASLCYGCARGVHCTCWDTKYCANKLIKAWWKVDHQVLTWKLCCCHWQLAQFQVANCRPLTSLEAKCTKLWVLQQAIHNCWGKESYPWGHHLSPHFSHTLLNW